MLKWILSALLLCAFHPSAVADFIPDLLLLKAYRPGMPVAGWLMSEKLDGVRAYWDGKHLYSRKGNLLHAPDWFISSLPGFELDGELWIGRGRFEQTLSIVSRDQPSPGWRQVGYYIFEAPNAHGGLMQRLQKLRDFLQQNAAGPLHIIDQHPCRDERHLQQTLRAIETHGGEGLVLRNPVSGYQTGRSDNALKVKSFDDMEGRVTGYRGGQGKYQGMTGSLQVEINGGIRFYIGSGLSDAERRSPPPLGSLVTFKYYGFSERGIPRFASFMRIRELPATP